MKALLSQFRYVGWLLTFLICWIDLSAQADFTADTLSGCGPLVVNFTIQAPGAVSYAWDFGNATQSGLANPGVTYITGGNFTVSVTVTFGNGSTQTVTKTNYIQVFDPPTGDFSSSINNICQGEDVSFTDLSTIGSAAITSWLWDFGDGNTANFQNPTHIFQNPGSFTTTLVVSDANGCSDTYLIPGNIDVNPTPNADFLVDNSLGCSTPFTANFTSFPNPPGVSHQWDFGNLGTSILSNPSETYIANGTFTVTHIVTDPLGCADTVTKVDLINIGQGTVNIQVSSNTVCVGEVVFFDCGATIGSTVNWNFGIPGSGSNICNPAFAYNAPGTYTVTATISDTSGCTFNASQIISVNALPVVDFSVSDTLLCNPPFTVNFTNNSSGASSYSWYFGDGNSSGLANPSHTYPVLPISSSTGQPYYYDVTLIAVSANGCQSQLSLNDLVVTGQTRAGFEAFPRMGCAPLPVGFMDESVTPSVITGWEWDFGVAGGTSLVQNPNFTYPNTGTFDVQLIIQTLHGCTDTVSFPGYIQAGDTPTADFIVDTTRNCASESFNFTNTSINADSADWIFSDGGSASTYDAVYQFQDTGLMDVTLIAYDRGCPDTLTVPQMIYIEGPIAVLIPPQTFVCELPDTVNFFDASIAADNYFWHFGNGDSAFIPNPSYIYTQEGAFGVTLTVTNDSTGCSYTTGGSVIAELVEANFVADSVVGCAPFNVVFTDSSVNPAVWTWLLGDNNSTFGSPIVSHTYVNPGIYDVTLITQNSIGCLDDTVMSQMITVYGPEVDFTTPDTTGCAIFDVPFTNLTTSVGTISSYQWDFGLIGGTSGAVSPTYSYQDAGVYDVTLTVTDSFGCSTTLIKEDHILVTDPIANFVSPFPINCIDNNVPFINLSSGQGLSYEWDLGNTVTTSVANPTTTYPANGSYDVTLMVEDFNGCRDTLSQTGYITIADPEVDFVPDTTFADCPPLLVNFTANAISPHPFTSWTWDFGDMTGAFQQNVGHIYTSPGVFDVELIATAPSGCADTVAYPDLITINGPTGDFDFSPQQGCVGTPIIFTATGTNVAVFNWDLGGGYLANGDTVIQQYAFPGTYFPLLIVEDTAGCEIIIQSPDSVVIFVPPVADFNIANPVLCDSGTVDFTSNSQGGGSPLSNYFWDFGDNAGTSNQPNPSYFYNQPGSYDIQLIVENSDGCRDTILLPGAVNVYPSPVAVAALVDSSGCEPFLAQFQDVSPASNNPIQTWDWDFGVVPPAGSSQQSPVFTYTQPGLYSADLIITDIYGCTASSSVPLEVYASPVANFTADDSFGCAPKVVQFTSLTTNAVDWRWNFGDGSPVSFDENPQHIYQQDGSYDVRLTVWDANGCTDSLLKPQYINLAHPEADFTFSDSLVCPGETILFSDLSQSDTMLNVWDWDFGDGLGSSSQQNPEYAYPGPGIYVVRLTVSDVFNCSDTYTSPISIRVLEDVPPVVPPIRSVSVIGPDEVEIRFDRFDNVRGDFGAYELYRENGAGNWILVATSTNWASDVLIDAGLNPEQQSYCYKLQVSNWCGTESDLDDSEPHCSVLLETTPLIDSIALSWSPYVGWPVSRYEIYRVNGYSGGGGVFLTSVPGDVNAFIDSAMFCYDAVTYRILAIQEGGESRAWSNISRETPIHFGPQVPLHMLRATVEGDSVILVEWPEAPPGEDLTWLVVEKDVGGGFEEIHRQRWNDPQRSLIDAAVAVQLQPYTYRAFVVDTCGDSSPAGRIARTIWLQGRRENNRIFLNWTAYEAWEVGVDVYRLEVYNEATQAWELVTRLTRGTVAFEDTETDLLQAQYCYRIIAEESGQTRQSSMSNVACVTIEPVLYFPNAFTPNGDLRNDRFVIKGVYVEDFHLEIFNRWGESIFQTENQDQGWDGVARGAPAPEGVYVFKARGVGYNGDIIIRTGTVTLIR